MKALVWLTETWRKEVKGDPSIRRWGAVVGPYTVNPPRGLWSRYKTRPCKKGTKWTRSEVQVLRRP